MKYIVFVCTGNSCRSAAAEFVMKKMLEDKGITDVRVTSVGTKNLHEEERDPEMVRIAAENGYDIVGRTQYMTREMLEEADLILCMADCHMDILKSFLDFRYWDRLHLFKYYCLGKNETLMDPHFQIEAVYLSVFHTIEKGCAALVGKLTVEY